MTYPGHTTNLLPISGTASWILICYLVVTGPVALLSSDFLSGEQNNPYIRHYSYLQPFHFHLNLDLVGGATHRMPRARSLLNSLHKYILTAYSLPGSEGDIRNVMNKIYSLVLFSRRRVSAMI